MNTEKDVPDLIRLIENNYKDRSKYVYRGINEVFNNKKDRISSSLYRWAKDHVGLKNKPLPHYFEEYIVRSAHRHFPTFTSNVETLTEIHTFEEKLI